MKFLQNYETSLPCYLNSSMVTALKICVDQSSGTFSIYATIAGNTSGNTYRISDPFISCAEAHRKLLIMIDDICGDEEEEEKEEDQQNHNYKSQREIIEKLLVTLKELYGQHT